MRLRSAAARCYASVTVHSLVWLAAGNAIGLLLATLLLFPSFGRLLGPLSFGRWVPLHLDLQLYGWCSLPLVGLLFRTFMPSRPGSLPQLALATWSGALVFGAISWLFGHSSGKLFLEWEGPARLVFTANLIVLGVALAWMHHRQNREEGDPVPRFVRTGKWLLLAALMTVPAVLYAAAGPGTYPPINPDSGGATGGNLLGSTLGIIAIVCLSPHLAGMRAAGATRGVGTVVAVLVIHFLVFGLLDHGNHSNHEPGQIAALSSLAIWIPILPRHLRRFRWPGASRRWFVAFCTWGGFLVVTAWLTFLPGVLEHWKFTNMLVGHAHAAMAGLVSNLCIFLLVALNLDSPLGRVFSDRSGFWGWQTGCALYVFSMMALGLVESIVPDLMFGPSALVDGFYGVRWLAGAVMLAVSVRWLAKAIRGSRVLAAAR